MKITITGSLGNISLPLTKILVADGHDLTVITSTCDRVDQIEELGANAAVGSIEDESFLTKTFKGSDAVYTMIPPNFAASDWRGYIRKIGEIYAKALTAAEIKHVVNLSSIGAHMPSGCGPVSGLHFVEKSLNAIPAIRICHLRPGFFYTNFFSQIPMIRSIGIMGGNYGENGMSVLVHPIDIAEAAADELLHFRTPGISIRYIVSDHKTTNEVASILGAAIGFPNLKWINFTDEDSLTGMIKAGLSNEIAQNYVEMGAAMRSGAMIEHYLANPPSHCGKINLEEFSKQFAEVYHK